MTALITVYRILDHTALTDTPFEGEPMDTPKRTLIKAIIWNVIGLACMALVGFVATGSLAVGGTMALINTAIGLSLYVVYERLWARIGWGRHV